jgi:predicted PurR-regulated permease PerM
MDTLYKIPFYAKAALIFICVFAFVFTMYIGQHIIVPIIYAVIISILLNPIVSFLVRKGINKIIAISIAVLLAISVVVSVIYLISSQLSMFNETYPMLKLKFNETSAECVQWVSRKFNIRESKVNAWIKETQEETVNNFALGETLSQMGRTSIIVMLLPVYLFMILYYKPLLLEFIRKLFSAEHHVVVAEVLLSTKTIIQSYLVGLFFEMVIIAVLNSLGLLLLGIDYAVILGITGAVVNIVPYIGGIVATALPMLIAFVTKDSPTYSLLVLGVYLIIQFIDNHYLIPRIVASRVKINALVSVIVVLIGGALWGISGMFLSIPLTAILKVIFDHIEPLKPWGFLLGNIVPTSSKLFFSE